MNVGVTCAEEYYGCHITALVHRPEGWYYSTRKRVGAIAVRPKQGWHDNVPTRYCGYGIQSP